MKRIMVTGAFGQIGSELVPALRKKFGADNVVAVGHRHKPPKQVIEAGPVDFVGVTNRQEFKKKVKKHDVDTLFHLAAILSARGEKNPTKAWRVNMLGKYYALEIARELGLEKVFIPSSIASFGPETPRDNTPQETTQRPTTIYGITKVAGELLGNYYFKKFAVDVRGVRFPGLISSESPPGGGTTDYAVHIFFEALKHKKYTCFLEENTYLPMMYMPDALDCMIQLMEAPIEKLKHHCDFNVNSMSFSPRELAAEIKKHVPEFTIDYKPDFRQAIADSWPKSLDDSAARREWGWKPKYDLASMTKDMLEKLSKKIS